MMVMMFHKRLFSEVPFCPTMGRISNFQVILQLPYFLIWWLCETKCAEYLNKLTHMAREGELSRTKKTDGGINSFGPVLMNESTPK